MHMEKPWQYMCRNIRQMHNPYWYLRKYKQIQLSLYEKYRHPTLQSRIQKLAITQHIRQTTPDRQIHTTRKKRVKINQTEWKHKWRTPKELHRSYQRCTPTQKIYRPRQLYMQKQKREARNFIKNRIANQSKIPDIRKTNEVDKVRIAAFYPEQRKTQQ